MFIRNCPICNIELSYARKNALKKAERTQSKCKKCMGDIISLKLKGIGKSHEHRVKLSISKVGKKLTDEHKEKIGKSIKGIKRSEESKVRYSMSKMGDKNPNYNPNKSEYERYRRLVDNITTQNKSKLLESWDGYDYYDGEYILDNLNLHYNCSLYPVIDHKIPVSVGYRDGIPPEDISSVDNLCITKRVLNGRKWTKDDSEFKDSLIKQR